MKRNLLSLLISALLFTVVIFSFSAAVSAENETAESSATTVSIQTTAERTDDEPFAGNNMPEKEETPTFYYILGGFAGIIIIFGVAGFITSKTKK